jgi:hypothetical protein
VGYDISPLKRVKLKILNLTLESGEISLPFKILAIFWYLHTFITSAYKLYKPVEAVLEINKPIHLR